MAKPALDMLFYRQWMNDSLDKSDIKNQMILVVGIPPVYRPDRFSSYSYVIG